MSGFTFGTQTPAASTGFSFGAKATPASSTVTFGGFGSTPASTAGTSLFGTSGTAGTATGFGSAGSAFGAFGTAKTTGTTTFGTGTALGLGTSAPSFGATPFGIGGTSVTSTGTLQLGGGFGQQTTGTLSAPGLFSQQQTQFNLQQQQQTNSLALMVLALSHPQLYGDERDGIIAKLNQLQAYWGTGKGFYNQQSAVDLTPENPFCRFKVVGYSRLPAATNEDGLVSLQIKKKESEVRQVQATLVDSIHKLLGSKPTLMVCVDGVKPLPDDSTEVVIYIVERAANGSTRKVPATDVCHVFSQQNTKVQLQNLGVANMFTKTAMNPEQLRKYLDCPPAGIDPLLWEQAKKDNPDPQRLIPVPITGFGELKKRLKYQEQETFQHQKRLDIVSEEITELQRNHATTMSKLAQFKRRHLELSHRVLEVMVKQESIRKSGYSVQADEEQLRVQLESLEAELNAPLQFKARLNELMSQIRLQSQGSGSLSRVDGRYSMEPVLQEELKQHLEQQQTGIMHLISIIKEDLEDLKTIEQGLGESLNVRR